MESYQRKCPKCNRTITHTLKWNRDAAQRLQRLCTSCGKVGRIPWNRGLVGYNKGRKCSLETVNKIRENRQKQSPPMLGKRHSKETKRKQRLSLIRNIIQRKGQCHPGYNPAACKLIEEYGKQHSYNFQHAENGGEFHIKELGYWVDGYDVEQNVVIEIYEDRHKRTKVRDEHRKNEIIQHLGCEFIIFRL